MICIIIHSLHITLLCIDNFNATYHFSICVYFIIVSYLCDLLPFFGCLYANRVTLIFCIKFLIFDAENQFESLYGRNVGDSNPHACHNNFIKLFINKSNTKLICRLQFLKLRLQLSKSAVTLFIFECGYYILNMRSA